MAEADESKDLDPMAVALGRRVTEERRRLGMTKVELATGSGLSPDYVWRVEAGRQNIQLRSLSRLAAALGITPSRLLEGVAAPEIEALDGPPTRKIRRDI